MSCESATLYCMLHDHLFLHPHAIPFVPMANRNMTSLAATEMGVWLTHSLTHWINPWRRHSSYASLWGFQISNNAFPLYLATLFSWIFYELSPCKYTLDNNLSTQNNFAPHTWTCNANVVFQLSATYQHCHFGDAAGFEREVKLCESESSPLTSTWNFIFVGHAVRRSIVCWDETEDVSTPALLDP
jgi:hypothetical protein